MAHIYCISCKTFVGWQIVSIIVFILCYYTSYIFFPFSILTLIFWAHNMEQVRKYTPHPIIFEGYCILLLGVGGAVIFLENKDCVNYK